MTPSRRRTAKKLVLPLIAVAVMTTMMAVGSASPNHERSVSLELYQR